MEYNLTASVTISLYTKVEADSLKEAIKIAQDRHSMSVHSSGGDTSDEVWMMDEIDGEVSEITEE